MYWNVLITPLVKDQTCSPCRHQQRQFLCPLRRSSSDDYFSSFAAPKCCGTPRVPAFYSLWFSYLVVWADRGFRHVEHQRGSFLNREADIYKPERTKDRMGVINVVTQFDWSEGNEAYVTGASTAAGSTSVLFLVCCYCYVFVCHHLNPPLPCWRL